MPCPAAKGTPDARAPCYCEFCRNLNKVDDDEEGGATSCKTLPKHWNRVVQKKDSITGPNLQDVVDNDECVAKKKRRKDIIIRNKKAIRCLSRRVRAEKELNRKREEAASKIFGCYVKTKPKKKEVRKPSSLVDMIRGKDDCACELMAHVIREDLHRSLALGQTRDAINAGSPDFTTPPRPPSPPPPRKRFYFF